MLNKKRKYISITLTFIATSFTVVIFLFLFIFIGIKHRKDVYKDSKLLVSNVSMNAVVETEQYFKNAFKSLHSLKETSLLLREAKVDRSVIAQLVKNELIENPNYLSVWTMWEHNSYDSLDHLYTNSELYDSLGYLSVTYFHFKDKIVNEDVGHDDYEEDFYVIPKNTKSDLFIEPYLYQYVGFPNVYYETSIVTPILKDSVFLGVFAIDIGLSDLQQKLNSIKLYKTGYLSLITNKGNIVSHPDSSFTNKNINDILRFKRDSINQYIQTGKYAELETKSEFIHKKVFRYFFPISTEISSNSWSIMIEIPVNEVTKRSQQLFWISIFTLIVGLALLVYLIFNMIDRKAFELEIIDAMLKAEESDRLKTAFLQNISHEIRTPLNSIIGFTNLLSSKNLSKKDKLFYCEIIGSSSDQLLHIISDLIELSKIQTSQITKNIRIINIENAIKNCAEKFQFIAEDKGLELKINLPKNENLLIHTDEDKLIKIFSYLLNNAIKFTHKGYIEIGCQIKESKMEFFVKDTGIGINPENYENIFNYFTQEDNTTTRNYGGLGAGLTITKSLVDFLGGSIYFESEINLGSTFYFYLPDLSIKITSKR